MQNNLNPNVILQQMMRNSSVTNNPIARNAFDMYQRGDIQGLNNLANNLCKERGITAQEAENRVKSLFKM